MQTNSIKNLSENSKLVKKVLEKVKGINNQAFFISQDPAKRTLLLT